MWLPLATLPDPVPFQPVLLTVAPLKSRKILRVAPGRLCSVKVWLAGRASGTVAAVVAAAVVVCSGCSSW